MIRRLVSLLPPSVIRFFGRMQYQLPLVGPFIGFVGRRFVSGQGVMKYGVGAGLKFDSTGLAPGFVLGTTDPLEQAAMIKYLKPGSVFYDVGANVGFFCVLAARLVNPNGRVYAFEPHPDYAERIRKNAALNGFVIEVIEAAVSNTVGETLLSVEGVSCPSIQFGSMGGGGFRVEVVSIDHLITDKGYRPPDYVVIDAEGAELKVLAGMAETLRSRRPVVLVEVHWLGQRFVDYIEQNVSPLGYEMRNLDGGPVPTHPVRFHALLTPTAERSDGCLPVGNSTNAKA